ncbi:hypothetical protein [Blautia hydrogenotrophica]|jgi:hypothetical protein|uniref:hypothetical protein n=1 Tax=Blautia hydrogenotrophica TaxID=53443 RepID=UPI003AB77FCA
MVGLDGKITIEKELRPCIVHIPEISYKSWNCKEQKMEIVVKRKEEAHKSLFHCWNPITGKGIVEYEDGTVHEVEPTQIRFVNNVMYEYEFPEMEESYCH